MHQKKTHRIIPRLNRPFVLASASPRRADLLAGIGMEIEIHPAEIQEPELNVKNTIPEQVAETAALKKAEHVATHYTSGLILGADTVVAFKNTLLGKPEDAMHAREMLEMLSGRQHQVYTGVALVLQPENIVKTFTEKTNVMFREISSLEIDRYLETDEPWDKAGAYGIQGLAGLFVHKIHGDYNNVVGFPLTAFYEALLELNTINGNEGFLFG